MSDEESKNNQQDYDAIAVHNIMQNEDCRLFMWEHLQSCQVFETVFDKDSIQHSFNAGVREAGLRLDRKLKEYEPEYYIKMIKENINE